MDIVRKGQESNRLATTREGDEAGRPKKASAQRRRRQAAGLQKGRPTGRPYKGKMPDAKARIACARDGSRRLLRTHPILAGYSEAPEAKQSMARGEWRTAG